MNIRGGRVASPNDGENDGVLVVTKPEAARTLGVCIRTIERLVAAQDLCAVRIRGCSRITTASIKTYFNRLTKTEGA